MARSVRTSSRLAASQHRWRGSSATDGTHRRPAPHRPSVMAAGPHAQRHPAVLHGVEAVSAEGGFRSGGFAGVAGRHRRAGEGGRWPGRDRAAGGQLCSES
ncbi:hypothetical protein G6F60_014997 [Rhizopus arrhizus]|nr:hypothetical protein G6F60_014997 [Rhizopus arrhizus]